MSNGGELTKVVLSMELASIMEIDGGSVTLFSCTIDYSFSNYSSFSSTLVVAKSSSN
jgi:hypothetical protein